MGLKSIHMEGNLNPQEWKLDMVSVRLVEEPPLMSDYPIDSPMDAVRLLGKHLCRMDREVVCAVNVQADGRPINCSFVSMGTINTSPVDFRQIFKAAILSNAASILLLHNHPSGSAAPSQIDRKCTEKLREACDTMGIYFLDHIIIGRDNGMCYSFQDRQYFYVDGLKTRTPTSGDSQPDAKLYGWSRNEIEGTVLEEAAKVIEQEGLDARITGVRACGSRMREKLFQEAADLDIVLAYEGHATEEEIFQATKGWQAAGMKLAIIPVRERNGMELEMFLERDETSLDRKEEQLEARKRTPKVIHPIQVPPRI